MFWPLILSTFLIYKLHSMEAALAEMAALQPEPEVDADDDRDFVGPAGLLSTSMFFPVDVLNDVLEV